MRDEGMNKKEKKVNLNNSPFILDITVISLPLPPPTEFFKMYLFFWRGHMVEFMLRLIRV
jgi:hypothetical protein